jgi:hypothetical protein
MLPFDRVYIENLSEDELSKLAYLDSLGFIVGVGETFEEYRKRLLAVFDNLQEFDQDIEKNDELELFEGVKVKKDKRIPVEIVDEASRITEKYYRFAINWVPGFFLSKNIGWLWGGCALSDTERTLTIFLIRSSFRNKRKWFIYDRRELLAHELCHAARGVINDERLEEFFAYQTAPSKIRRYMGNCFIYKHDAILFLVPTLILLAAQMLKTFNTSLAYPIWPFWILALIYPVFLLLRNGVARLYFFRACSKLLAFGFKDATAVLFRCDWLSVKKISTLASPEEFRRFVQKNSSSDLHWRIIQHRFIINNGESELADVEEADDSAA